MLKISLAYVESAWVQLRGLELRHPLMGHDALAQVIDWHYVSAALGELLKVVGSLDIFADAVRLVQGLGLGVWKLLATPAHAALHGSVFKFFAGLVGGISGMIHSTAFATSNSLAKGTRRARATLLALCTDEVADAILRPPLSHAQSHFSGSAKPSMYHHPRSTQATQPPAAYARPPLLLSDPYGVANGGGEPSRHATQEHSSGSEQPHRYSLQHQQRRDVLHVLGSGYSALLGRLGREAVSVNVSKELLNGCLQAAVIPVIVLMEMVETSARSIRTFVSSRSRTLLRARVPRYVDPHAPLQPYNWLESFCRMLQHQVMGSHFCSETFVGCAAMAHNHFALLTHSHLICVYCESSNGSSIENKVVLVLPVPCLVRSFQCDVFNALFLGQFRLCSFSQCRAWCAPSRVVLVLPVPCLVRSFQRGAMLHVLHFPPQGVTEQYVSMLAVTSCGDLAASSLPCAVFHVKPTILATVPRSASTAAASRSTNMVAAPRRVLQRSNSRIGHDAPAIKHSAQFRTSPQSHGQASASKAGFSTQLMSSRSEQHSVKSRPSERAAPQLADAPSMRVATCHGATQVPGAACESTLWLNTTQLQIRSESAALELFLLLEAAVRAEESRKLGSIFTTVGF
eukprot:gene1332-32689_t